MIRPAGCHGVKAMPKVRLIPSDVRMLLAHYGNPLLFQHLENVVESISYF